MNINLLLNRLGVNAPDSSLSTLRAVHRAFTLAVPFENVAILEGEAISLEPEAIFHKIVERRRGGYCFELNTLLVALLQSLGFQVERLLGRVWANGALAPTPTHMAVRVTVENQAYLCDVGFGGGTLREPLPWETGSTVTQGPDSFRLDPTDNGETMLSGVRGAASKNLYSLLPCTMRPQDYLPANHYTSTHPDSFFTQYPVAALTTSEGRTTLQGRLFRRVGAQGVEERELENFEELVAVWATFFYVENVKVGVLKKRLSGLFAKP